MEFTDPRLVALDDAVNAYEPGPQPDFYTWLAGDVGATTIVDLGCGTGLVTCALAALPGVSVVGVEPSRLMLEQARRRCEGVRWVHGDASAIPEVAADLAVLTGHVAQLIVDDDEWAAALAALRRALRPGGRLAFESRDPRAREWESWGRGEGAHHWSEAEGGPVDGVLSYTNHDVLPSGETVVSPCRLRFRTLDELAGSLGAAGFRIERTYGWWDHRPVGEGTELVVVAVADG